MVIISIFLVHQVKIVYIYADFECLLFKMDSCEKCPDNSYTEKKSRQYLVDIL